MPFFALEYVRRSTAGTSHSLACWSKRQLWRRQLADRYSGGGMGPCLARPFFFLILRDCVSGSATRCGKGLDFACRPQDQLPTPLDMLNSIIRGSLSDPFGVVNGNVGRRDGSN